MHFCPNCGRVMSRDPSSGSIVFRCACGKEVQGTPADSRIGGAVLGAGEKTEMYRSLIRNAAFDRTNNLVEKPPCSECGRDYATQIRVGADEVIIYKCKCGLESSGNKA